MPAKGTEIKFDKEENVFDEDIAIE